MSSGIRSLFLRRMANELVVDASVLLNVLATDVPEVLLRATGLESVIPSIALVP